MSVQVMRMTDEQIEDAGRVIAEAMMIEPGYAAIMPDEDVRHRTLIPMLTASIRKDAHRDSVFVAVRDGKVLGVAIWGPPGSFPPRENGNEAEVPDYLKPLDQSALEDLSAYDEACIEHFPEEPVWYLKMLGVCTEGRGNGVGSQLMRESLLEFEADGLPFYLETGTERNVRFYERFGFEIREAGIQLAPGSTPHWTMMRPARTS
jgi:GNAT superfamily N-acetyltransferase